MSTTIEKIQRQIAENPILLYMKGSPKLPSCGFSAQAVQALAACGERFAYVDILQNPDIRAELPKYANWPTFPQLWVDGELVGGCDIVIEMYQRGELQQLIKETAAKYKSEGTLNNPSCNTDGCERASVSPFSIPNPALVANLKIPPHAAA